MKIYKYIHSCVLLEEKGRGLLFDPGVFNFMEGHVKAEKFIDLDAIIITHIHADHLDMEAMKIIAANNPQAVILTNTQIAAELQKAGIVATVLENGSMQTGVFTVEALPAPHERALLADSFPDHAAYRVNGRVLHPGDSMAMEVLKAWKGTEVLLFAAIAPWANELQVFTFVKAMQPSIAVPIHDGYVKDFFRVGRHQMYGKFLERESITVVPLEKPNQHYEIV